MSEIKTVSFSDFGAVITGKTPSSSSPEDFGTEIPFVTPSDSFDSKYIIETSRFLSKEGAQKLNGKILPQDSVLVTCIGSAMGKIAMISRESVTNQQINSIIINEDFDPHYVYYCLVNNYKLIRNAAGGSTALPLLNKTDFEILKCSIHSLKEHQSKIASVLSAIDAKIELNNRINAELEAMAKTLYDYWFVQFDFPDANGKPYKTSGGKMVYNAELKRDVPEGWEWKPIEKLIDVRDGTHDSPKPSVTGQYLITSKHLKESGIDLSDAYLISDEDFEAVNKRSKVDEGDFLLSMIGTIGLSQWVMKIETPFAIKNIGLFKTSKSPAWADYIFSSVTSDIGKFYLKQNQSTGTSQPYVTLGTLRSIPIIIPSDFIFQSFTEKVRPLHKAISA